MKLTDANKIRDYVKEQINPYGKPFEGSVYEFGLKIIHYIDNMSTDYDIDKVVEKLEDEFAYWKADHYHQQIADAKAVSYAHAIEIVKHGSISDDVCEWKRDNTFIGMYKTCSDYVTYHKSFKYCPYCGKKIKVVE